MKNDTMQALVLHDVGDLRVENIPLPSVEGEEGRGKVRVRVGFCGVCGSDIPRIFVKGTYSFPTVCGHEFAGTVDACGPGVEDFSPGDRVAVFPLIWCGKCAACEAGKYVMCHNYDYLGSRSNGAFADAVVAPRENLLRVPDGVSLEEASMTEPASVALHALRRAGGSLVGETVAILGAGPIGLMVAQWARIMGADRVVIFDIQEKKLELARSMGFSLALNSGDQDPVEALKELTGGEGAHLTVEAAGVPPTFVQALSSTRRGGRMVMLGNPSGDVTLPASLISQAMRREILLVGTWNSEYSASGNDDDWGTVLSAMASGTLNLKPLITHRVPLGKAIDQLQAMKSLKEFYAKVLVHPE